ncbi:hypothetical protein J2Y66_001426 [Paenarthrobacter nitroguajacolicus]|uniref:hypothetical protein n=1 Tax=Paenarthrobacter nitroguajacolicus TaxID=211146 RepID=UPI00285743E9|nr:hypothetical protein [Paenarthrobacter nitroguajacolicus]MDR6986956.1 hypothetical protein [Paenarthrobacter nitroguajacolicus]
MGNGPGPEGREAWSIVKTILNFVKSSGEGITFRYSHWLFLPNDRHAATNGIAVLGQFGCGHASEVFKKLAHIRVAHQKILKSHQKISQVGFGLFLS